MITIEKEGTPPLNNPLYPLKNTNERNVERWCEDNYFQEMVSKVGPKEGAK